MATIDQYLQSIFEQDEFPLNSCFDVHQGHNQGHRTCMGMNQTWLLHPKNVGIMWQNLPLKSMNMTIYLVVYLPLWKMMEIIPNWMEQ